MTTQIHTTVEHDALLTAAGTPVAWMAHESFVYSVIEETVQGVTVHRVQAFRPARHIPGPLRFVTGWVRDGVGYRTRKAAVAGPV